MKKNKQKTFYRLVVGEGVEVQICQTIEDALFWGEFGLSKLKLTHFSIQPVKFVAGMLRPSKNKGVQIFSLDENGEVIPAPIEK